MNAITYAQLGILISATCGLKIGGSDKVILVTNNIVDVRLIRFTLQINFLVVWPEMAKVSASGNIRKNKNPWNNIVVLHKYMTY